MQLIQRWALSALFLAMLAPLALISDWYARETYAASTGIFHLIAGIVIAALALTMAPHRPQSLPLPVLAFWLWAAGSILWSIAPFQTFQASAALALYIFAFMCLLRSPYIAHAVRNAAWAVVVGLLLLAAYLGLQHRTFGGINPNMVSSYGFAVLVLLALVRRINWKWIVGIGALMIFTQSRTLLVTFFVFVAMRYFLIGFHRRGGSAPFMLLMTFLSVPLILLATNYLLPFLIKTSRYIGVSENERLSSTLTGRTRFWEAGMNWFERQPLRGYGYYTREATDVSLGNSLSAHSGMINLLLDLGMIGAFLFAIWFIAALIRSAYGVRGWHYETTLSCMAALVAFVPRLMVEPGYIGLYDPGAIALLFCLCLPFVTRPEPRRRAPPPETAAPRHIERGRVLEPETAHAAATNLPVARGPRS